MEQFTPKFDQLKKRFLSKVNTLEGSRLVDFVQTSTDDGVVSDHLLDITKSNEEHNDYLKKVDYDLSNMELVEDLLHVGLSKTLGCSSKKAKSKSKNKITTLRQSVNDVRQHENNYCFSEINQPCLIIQPQTLIYSKIANAVTAIHNSFDFLHVTGTTRRPPAASKILNFDKVDKNMRIAISTQDTHEVIGWFQEKVKLLTKEFSLSSSDSASRPAAAAGRRSTSYTPSATTSSSSSSSDIDNTPKHWEELQLYLDHLKTEVRKSNQRNRSTSIPTPSISAPIVGNKSFNSTESMETLQVINKLHELSLLLLAMKVNEKVEYMHRLHTTIEEQAELTEGYEERILELREKIHEYGRENSDLENRIVELQRDLHHVRSVRNESADCMIVLQQHCDRLETLIQQKDIELHEFRHQNQLQQEELLLNRSSERHTGGSNQQQPIGDRIRYYEVRSSLLSSDSSESDSQSLESVAEERRHKTAAATSSRAAAAQGGVSRRTTRGSTHHTVAQDPVSSSHTHSNPTSRAPSLQSIFQQIKQLNEINWQNVFQCDHMNTIAELQLAEDDLSSIEAELENSLHRFKSTQRQLRQHFSARQKQLDSIEEEKQMQNQAKTATSEVNVCCICLEGKKSILLLPCRHLCVCEQCSQGPTHTAATTGTTSRLPPGGIRTCPICRARVEECLKVFS